VIVVMPSSGNPPLVATNSASDLGDGDASPYGPYATEQVRWRGHNPTELAVNLAGLRLTLRTGNGLPGGPGGDPGDPVEMEVHEEAINMHEELERLKIPHVWDDYGAGGHTWFYWQRSLRQTLPALLATFADPPAPPRTFTHKSIDPSFSVYGWDVTIDRPALEFAELQDASRDGFELVGSGTATVRTARVARARARVTAKVSTLNGPVVTRRLRADAQGRVRLALDLGPGNAAQQDTPQARLAGGTKVRRVRVELTPERSAPKRTRSRARR